MSEKVSDTPRAEFFDSAITDGNRDAPIVVKVSPSGELVHVMTVDSKGAVTSNERRLGIGPRAVSMLLGRLLTLTDATFPDDRQCKAFKDMTRQHVREWLSELENRGMASAGFDEYGHVGHPFEAIIAPPPEGA
jgi:hypothetical protein